MPVFFLAQWGLIIYLMSGLLIFLGLFPYKQLKWKENNPDKLILSPDGALSFYKDNQLKWQLPLTNIEKIEYKENNKTYGLELHFKHDNQCIFLHYFQKYAEQELEEIKMFLS